MGCDDVIWVLKLISPFSVACLNDVDDCPIHSSSQCYKTLFGGNLDFPKIKKLNKVCSNV